MFVLSLSLSLSEALSLARSLLSHQSCRKLKQTRYECAMYLTSSQDMSAFNVIPRHGMAKRVQQREGQGDGSGGGGGGG